MAPTLDEGADDATYADDDADSSFSRESVDVEAMLAAQRKDFERQLAEQYTTGRWLEFLVRHQNSRINELLMINNLILIILKNAVSTKFSVIY